MTLTQALEGDVSLFQNSDRFDQVLGVKPRHARTTPPKHRLPAENLGSTHFRSSSENGLFIDSGKNPTSMVQLIWPPELLRTIP